MACEHRKSMKVVGELDWEKPGMPFHGAVSLRLGLQSAFSAFFAVIRTNVKKR